MFQKLLLLVLVVAAAWLGVKAYRRFKLARERHERRESQREGKSTLVAEDMVKCSRCGTYVAGPRHCGRADCPYPA